MATPALVVEKVRSFEAGEFNETTDYQVLHCANVDGNNNKFYILEIQRNPKTGYFRLFSNYGRLGVDGVYEIRQHDKAGSELDESRCMVEFEKIIKKKKKGKTVNRNGEKIREFYSEVDVVSPSIGSSNIRNASEISVKGSAPAVNTAKHDTESSRLLRGFVRENIHSITSSTTMTFSKNGLETPLGPVTENHLDNATSVLDELRDKLNGHASMDADDKMVRKTNGEYFSLIPRKFGRKITDADMILTPDHIAAEYDLLSNLRTAVRAGLNAHSSDKDAGLDIDINMMDHGDSEFRRLSDKYETTKHRSHSGIHGYHVKNIFHLDIPDVTKRYEPVLQRLGNERELFHGTKTANMLSIAINGLIIPPTGAAHVTGRMFGNGVYAASCSTKALNYAVGFWSNSISNAERNKAYMLMVRFAMGKEYVATSHRYGGAPTGYDSVWGKAGTALLNDEFIVYNLNQATITHILELEK